MLVLAETCYANNIPPDVRCVMENTKECISVSAARMYRVIWATSFYNRKHKIKIHIETQKMNII